MALSESTHFTTNLIDLTQYLNHLPPPMHNSMILNYVYYSYTAKYEPICIYYYSPYNCDYTKETSPVCYVKANYF